MNRFNKNIFPLIIFILLMNALYGHEIHISHGKSQVTAHEFSGKLTFFKDDFMAALAKWHGKSLEGLSNAVFDQLKADYLATHFNVISNEDQLLTLNLTGHSEDDRSIWFYFKFESAAEIQSLRVTHNALFDVFEDQVNMLQIYANSRKYHYLFDISSREWRVQF